MCSKLLNFKRKRFRVDKLFLMHLYKFKIILFFYKKVKNRAIHYVA